MSGRTRSLLLSWVGLLVLLALTTALAYAPLGRFSLPVSLTIAVAKAVVILVVFMELAQASGLTRIIATAGFFWLGIQIGLPVVDYLSRTEQHVTEKSIDESVVPAPQPRR